MVYESELIAEITKSLLFEKVSVLIGVGPVWESELVHLEGACGVILEEFKESANSILDSVGGTIDMFLFDIVKLEKILGVATIKRRSYMNKYLSYSYLLAL